MWKYRYGTPALIDRELKIRMLFPVFQTIKHLCHAVKCLADITIIVIFYNKIDLVE
jgi:hypothetical protein